jgi:ABC-type sugar transport system substrate-binding protein
MTAIPKFRLARMAILVLLSPAACDRFGQARNADRDVRIFVVGPSQDDETWPVLGATIRQFEGNFPYVHVELSAPLNRTAEEQRLILETFLHHPPQAMVIMPVDPYALPPVINRLVKNGTSVVMVGRDVPDSARTAFCGVSEFEIGTAIAAACDQVLKGRSRTVMLLHGGTVGDIEASRYFGFKQGAALKGPMKVLREVDGGNDAIESARLARIESRRYPRIGCWAMLDDWPLRVTPDGDRLLPLGVTMVLPSFDSAHWDRLQSGQIQAIVTYDVQKAIDRALMTALSCANGDNVMRQSLIPAEIITELELSDLQDRWALWRKGIPSSELSAGSAE